MNFDRYSNADQDGNLINETKNSTHLENERLRILRSQKADRKLLIFIDNEIQDHGMLLSYYEKNDCSKLVAMDPYLHFDLYYNAVRTSLLEVDLTILHSFIHENLLAKMMSSKSPEDKEWNFSVA